EPAARLQEMAGLQPEEGHACAGFDREPTNPAGFPVDSGGNVDREHAAPCMAEGVDPLDDRLRFAIDVARKPRAEQSVDHAIGFSEVERGGGEDRALVASRGERRVAFQGIAAADEAELDRKAALAEQAAGDEAVAAVAARPTENGNPAARLRKPRLFVSDREP